MGVKFREKQLSNGQISFYLDIYHNKARWYEFLDIKIQTKNRYHPRGTEFQVFSTQLLEKSMKEPRNIL